MAASRLTFVGAQEQLDRANLSIQHHFHTEAPAAALLPRAKSARTPT